MSLPVLFEASLVPREYTQCPVSPILLNPSQSQDPAEVTLMVQPAASSPQTPIATIVGLGSTFPWHTILQSVPTPIPLNILSKQHLSMLSPQMKEAFSSYLTSVSDKDPYAVMAQASKITSIEHSFGVGLIEEPTSATRTSFMTWKRW